MADYEQALANSLFYNNNNEKSFLDKVLSRQDVEQIRELMKKVSLNRQDMVDLLYMLSSIETKLLNYGEWDRYVMAKFFVWIREFVGLREQLFDYQDDLKKKQEKGMIVMSKRTEQIFSNVCRLMDHNIKFLVDLYFNLGRTTLSLGATGFLEILKNKYELVYPNQQSIVPEEKKKLINFKWK